MKQTPSGPNNDGPIRYRNMRVASNSVIARREGDTWYLESETPLGDYPTRITDRLESGARHHPDRWFIAQRVAGGSWEGVTYQQMLSNAKSIGQALLNRGLSAERPLVILSGNDIAHAQLALGAMWAGIPYSPLSPAYSLVSTDFGKLRYIIEKLTPGLVFATDATVFAAAISAVVPMDTEIVSVSGTCERTVTKLAELLYTSPTNVDEANEVVGSDTIAKFIFTSGSTKLPKAVPTTHRMLCSNQQMLLQTFPEFAAEPPVIVDWLPWNHTFGGSHNFGIALYNGGTFYIDDGKPVKGKFDETLRNLRDVAPTIYFNVPKGWEELTSALEKDAELSDTFFSRVKAYFFGGAGLSQAAWNRLEAVTEAHCGERIRIMAGLGMTECSPCCFFATNAEMSSGHVGLPAPGCKTKLVPVDGKLEARFAGPHVMRGYWRMEDDLNSAVFDEEGYYCSGDALKFLDSSRPEAGMVFDGRIAEDFKLSSGTFVSVGPMRARLISEGAPYVQDAVITGIDRDEVGALIFPALDRCRVLAGYSPSTGSDEVLNSNEVRSFFTSMLQRLNQMSTGTATTIGRVRLLHEPPSLDHGEITDKGSINQRAVLARRAEIVEAMYAHIEEGPTIRVMRAPQE